MRRTTSIFFVLLSLLPIILAQVQSQTRSKDPADIEAVKQVELDLGNFQISGDFDKYSQLVSSMLTISQSSGPPATLLIRRTF